MLCAAMERLQGPMNPCFYGGDLDLGRFESCLRFDEEEELQFLTNSLEEYKMPFLELLQSVEYSPPLLQIKEQPSFETLLRLHHFKDTLITNGHHEIPSSIHLGTDRITPDHQCNQDQLRQVLNSEENSEFKSSAVITRERRKRKRRMVTKNKEEIENQRMIHIAVERKRRRQMNDHLNVLRSLVPTSYIHRGDQASIIGGAIDFVKELEQLLQSLEERRRISKPGETRSSFLNGVECSEEEEEKLRERRIEEGISAEKKSEVGDFEVTVIQSHVNLKIKCPKRPGQLLKAIVALEDLKLVVMHLNVTTSASQDIVLYSFNLKKEEECNLGSAGEIAEAVHQILHRRWLIGKRNDPLSTCS